MDTSPTSLLRSYTPRVAIVTGSSQGIGYDIALRLADDGIDIVVNDIPSKAAKASEVVAQIQKKGRRAIFVSADVSSETDVIAMIEKAVQELGSVDIMVANAGIGPLRGFLETSVEQFNTIMAINTRGVFLCYKHAALQMIKQGRGGRLIGATSSAGKQGTKNLSAYSASKFAVRGLTQSASIELRKYGITANAYAPGIINSPLSLTPDFKGAQENGSASIKDLLGMPKETSAADADVVASIVSYLAKPEAYFINGQSISVDGGLRYD
ncbi:hypothetical protein EW145_g6446 [Phellinidium pouzarii]|uniref:Uncharacterized protein n=1 Tax=Phellinidium pouzarii TaxID=167371 RepID=A0A4V3XBT4_9AGAM|nr:hypothetical protein EW145_g6446 [Phellinidium pouzarii]